MRAFVLSCLALGGCSVGHSSTVCPPLVQYSAPDQKQVSAELGALPAGDPLVTMVIDYGKLRDEIRAACGS